MKLRITIPLIEQASDFPDPLTSPGNAPLGYGLHLSPRLMLAAYRRGIFAWSVDPVTWWSPDPRAIFDLDGFRLTTRLARKLRQHPFRITLDAAFDAVVLGCAAPRRYAPETWITPEFATAFSTLHSRGIAHSVECWQGEMLVGGVFGVAIGGFFSAESMFHTATDASKVALYYLLDALRDAGFTLFDSQVLSAHTASLGAYEIPRAHYLHRLHHALRQPTKSLVVSR